MKLYMLKRIKHWLYFLPITGIVFCCENFTETGVPKTELIGTRVYTTDETATAAVTGIYSRMVSGFGGFANYRTTLWGGLSADELDNFSTDMSQVEFYENALSPTNNFVGNLWSEPYNYIYHANAVLEGLENANGISPVIRRQLRGEALFIRAFCHFYLVNWFGGVPYITTTDYRENSLASRLPEAEVYPLLIADLEQARELLEATYVTGERIRPNRHTATALLARVYLYSGDWLNAETMTTEVIDLHGIYELEEDPDKVFLANSTEAIWQLRPVAGNRNTVEGYSFILTAAPANSALSHRVIDAFEPGDIRKTRWTGSIISGNSTYYYPYKYKVRTGSELSEYYMVFRLAELYLVRAEARARQGNISGAGKDLNIIRNRAGLANTTAATQAEMLDAVFREKRVEFFAEWGHRWFDLKRTGRAGTVLGTVKPGWQPTDVLYPVPHAEIQNNPNMEQNPGYE
ncbi:RagB/SusD family nutrient uptake outer membrane protein [Sinomicrobium pectinilyticum]|uniref:RagB/SusD family nutrient uptake outer membrane protein n=1 Tax=Sinomicrobium pectinilyticum TaxID=1084421 RepID=A0A3N0CYZ6_SINP1|nr:RagB/SusD family nutrient uptake outer membrane protein [Sinomicrobium pectinilyticum]RNL68628.1 RagB/SusD family nutrient uptake outer membrane protein [Sinomicrobium pectinilyticum]